MKRTIGEKIGRFLEEHFPELLSFAGLTGISVLDIFNFEIIWLFLFFCTLGISAIFFNFRRKRANFEMTDQNSRLKEEISTLKKAIAEGNRNFYDVWNDRARSLFQECDLSNCDRLSIFKHDTGHDRFRLLGRYAVNNAFRKQTQILYPMQVGVIGKAWQNGEHYEKSLPNPDRSFERYVEENEKKYGIARETCESLTMKSTCLWAKSLSNGKDVPFALVVVESTKRENLNKTQLCEFFNGPKRAEIENLLDHLEFMEPNLRLAQEMGF